MLSLLRFLRFFSKSKKSVTFYIFCRVSYVFSNYAARPRGDICETILKWSLKWISNLTIHSSIKQTKNTLAAIPSRICGTVLYPPLRDQCKCLCNSKWSNQWWANPNRDWDLNRDLSVFWEWFDQFWDWFGMRDWDLIRFGIFCNSIRSVGFDSRTSASCRSECLNSRGSAAAAWNAAIAAGRPKQLTNWQQHFLSD